MVASRTALGGIGAVIAVAGLVLSPAILAARETTENGTKPRVSLTARGGVGSFTPAAADPKLAALLARTSLSGASFRFTPSGESGKSRQVTVAVRARSVTLGMASALTLRTDAPTIASLGVTPSAYNLGASIGWKRFAFSGDLARIDTGLAPGSREVVSAGASYSTPKWTGRVQLDADQAIGFQPRMITPEKSYSLDVGGSYRLTRNLDVTAGVRYRLDERDRLQPLADNRRDSQAVYLGTAFKF